MKNRGKNTEKQSEKNINKSIAKKGVLEIGKKLGLTIPAGLLLLFNVSADATTQNQPLKENITEAKELHKLQTNEIVKHLLSGDKIIIAQVHSNVGHTNVNDPNVTNDGKHLNVHTDTPHTDYTRY
jgi:hypothetical protein